MADDDDSYTNGNDDSCTEVTSTGWGSRLSGSFKGIFGGLVLFVLATGLMYWNEGNSVRTGDAIAEAERVAVELADISRVDAAFNGKVVHAAGRAATQETMTDPLFGVSAKAISLRRAVEYYQWVENTKSETRQKLGGGEETVTTYTYARQWVDEPVDSANFKKPEKHRNHVKAQIKSEQWQAADVTLGAYRLPAFLVSEIEGRRALHTGLNEADVAGIQRELSVEEPVRVRAQDNMLYLGDSPSAPQVGDVRVSFSEVPPADISVIAKVYGGTFEAFRASNGTAFSELRMGMMSMDAMFQSARDDNEVMTWILRIIATVLAIGGLWLLLMPLKVLADVLPLLGSLVGVGTGLIACVVGLAWSLVVIALSWLRFRPLLALCLLGVAAALVGVLFLMRRKTGAAA